MGIIRVEQNSTQEREMKQGTVKDRTGWAAGEVEISLNAAGTSGKEAPRPVVIEEVFRAASLYKVPSIAVDAMHSILYR